MIASVKQAEACTLPKNQSKSGVGGVGPPGEEDFRFKDPIIVSLDVLAGIQVQKEASFAGCWLRIPGLQPDQ